MTTREQALAALDFISTEHWAIREDPENKAPTCHMSDMGAAYNILRSYLAQPEGGDAEGELEEIRNLHPEIEDCHAFERLRSALRSAKEREAAAVEKAKIWYEDQWKVRGPVLPSTFNRALDNLKETP